MAEGIQLESFSTKYYCHHCSREVFPFHTAAELICPDCSSGFLEEVSRDMFSAESYSCTDDDESDLEDVSNISFLPNTMDSFFNRVMMMSVAGGESAAEARRQRRPFRPDGFGDILRQIDMGDYLNAEEELEESQFLSFRYFDDYTGDEEIDAVSSQLLDEVGISGPPPLSQGQIKSLPYLLITADVLEKDMQCTVCMDDFNLKDKAKRLPCNHLYHEKCITPWLQRQATCPNCREVIRVESKSKRSRSCPRTRLNARNGDNRRFSEVSALNNYFTRRLRGPGGAF